MHNPKTGMIEVPAIGMTQNRVLPAEADSAMLWSQPRSWLAWKLRHLADRVDNERSVTQKLIVPPLVRHAVRDATQIGVNATVQYLHDLYVDLSVPEPSDDPR